MASLPAPPGASAGALALPARMDSRAAPALAEALRTAPPGTLRLDASGVRLLGGLCLQLLLAAARERGPDLVIDGLGPETVSQLAVFGLAPADVAPGGVLSA
jgi:anti-anti-sigma regulatory factor